MKWQALIVLLAIAFTIAVPPVLILPGGPTGQAMIGTLDICHSATPALSSNGSMPFIQASSCHPLHLTLQETSEIIDPFFKPAITTFQDDRPPKV